MDDKLVKARICLEQSVDESKELSFSALRASVLMILEYLEEASA